MGSMQCATKVDYEGVAAARDMYECVNTAECGDQETVNGNPVSVKFVDVASYTNNGSRCMSIEFQYSTGFEDTTSSNWNVEASVSAEFSVFGAEFGASLTAGGGGASSSSSGSEVSHSLSYQVSPFTRVTLKQLVAKAGNIQAHSFKIRLDEVSLISQDELIETIPGEKAENGTAVDGLIPCPTIGGTEYDDGGSDGDDGGDDGDEDECSNEKYGETEEETEDEKNEPPKIDKNGNVMKKKKKKNEHCSTKSQEEADKEKEEREKKKNENASVEDEDEEGGTENEDEEEEYSTTTTTTTTTRRTTTKKPRRRI